MENEAILRNHLLSARDSPVSLHDLAQKHSKSEKSVLDVAKDIPEIKTKTYSNNITLLWVTPSQTTKNTAETTTSPRKALPGKKRNAPSSLSFAKPFKSPLKSNNAPLHPTKKQKLSSEKSTKPLEEMSITELKEEEESLLKSIEAKKKRIQELQHKQQTLTKAGNEDGKVDALIDKWRATCQEVLLLLQQKNPQPIALSQLLQHFQIDPSFLNYNEETDSFS